MHCTCIVQCHSAAGNLVTHQLTLSGMFYIFVSVLPNRQSRGRISHGTRLKETTRKGVVSTDIIQSALCVNGITITGVVSTDIIPQALRLKGVAIKDVVSTDITPQALRLKGVAIKNVVSTDIIPQALRLNGYHPVGTRLKVIAPTAVAPKDNVSAPWSLDYRFSSFTFLQELCLSYFCLPGSVTFILFPLLFK